MQKIITPVFSFPILFSKSCKQHKILLVKNTNAFAKRVLLSTNQLLIAGLIVNKDELLIIKSG